MKLHIPKDPPKLYRINIKRSKYKTLHIAIHNDMPMEKALEQLKQMLLPHLSGIATGDRVTVELREAHGNHNGRTKSFKFYGLTQQQAHDIIIQNLKK